MHCGSADLAATLLRELAKLREELPWQSVRALVQPWITLFQDAGQLAKDRATLSAAAFAEADQAILDRFDALLLGRSHRSARPECQRLWNRKSVIVASLKNGRRFIHCQSHSETTARNPASA